MVVRREPAPNPATGLEHVRIGVVSDGPGRDVAECLRREGVPYERADDLDAPDVLLLDLAGAEPRRAEALARSAASARAPVIAVIAPESLEGPDYAAKADDVIVAPWPLGELALRVRRRLARDSADEEPGVIRVEDLVINPNRYDVYLAGKPVLLTFKEYELLKLLASTPGRVYSREALLEQVWGYQYFGGTRTVDVHIRRLRSKIEDANHTFIDTVWNVGYRFRG